MYLLESKMENFMDMMAIKMNQQNKATKRLEGRIEQIHHDNQLIFKNHSSLIHTLEVQMGQLANYLSIKNQSSLPSNTKKTLKNN